ncbi:MAG TPA: hypothetical protein VGL62_03605, partial [Vicinamibacterales bacterium]
MPTITAIEFGADTCAIARTNARRGAVAVSAVETLDPRAFPGSDALAKGLRQARRSLKLPRRARVVLWGMPDGANRKDPAVAPLLAPLVQAGFRIERVVSPCNALGALSRLRTPRPNGATCWLAINRTGVAIIAVRPGRLLYSRFFEWDSTVGATGSQARLLQRYSLVAFLAPEVRRAMNAAREQGTPIGAIVTCGNLPDLRSLTMPLIEELDVEVETLDSFEGLAVKPGVADKSGDAAAALRIACAAALARGTRPAGAMPPSRTRWLTPAAALILVVGLGWLTYAGLMQFSPRVGHPASITKQSAPPPKSSVLSSRPKAIAGVPPPAAATVRPPTVRPDQLPIAKRVQPPVAAAAQPPTVRPDQLPPTRPVQPPAATAVQVPTGRPAQPLAARPVQPTAATPLPAVTPRPPLPPAAKPAQIRGATPEPARPASTG